MKESIKKIFAILILLILTINSSFLIVVSTAVDEIKNLIDETKVKPIVEINIEKYINYKLSDESKGLLLQTNIKTGIEYEEDEEYTPIRTTKTIVNLPQIDGKYPESLEVIANSTKATNGDDNGKDMNYNYEKENGKLEIVVENKQNENGDIYKDNINDAKDEFVVISNYGADCYNDKNVKRNLNIAGTVEEILSNEDKTSLKKDFTENFEEKENISGLISTKVDTSDIYNGYIYSNKQNGTKYLTEYTENMNINVSYKDIADELTVETNNNFINSKDKEVETDEIIYKGVKINKENVLDILGEDGSLQILTKSGEVLGEINKDTEVPDDEVVEINYENEQSEIIVKTTKPTKVGTIKIESKKAIKETMTDLDYKKIQIKNEIKAFNNEQEINSFVDSNTVDIQDSETSVDLNLNNTEWTNNFQNNVVMTAVLVSNQMKNNLFENPVIEIKLPKKVENVIINNINMLYSDKLSIKNSEVIDKDNCKVIKIEVEGNQNEYNSNPMVDGPEIIIETSIIVKKDIDSGEENIELSYSNKNGNINDYKKQGQNSKNIGIKIESAINTEKLQNNTVSIAENNDITGQAVNGLVTEVKAQVGTDVLKENDIVYRGEAIKFTVSFKNDTEKAMNNVSAIYNIPEGTVYVTRNSKFSDIQIPGEAGNYENDLYNKHTDLKSVEVKKEILQPGEIYQEEYFILLDKLNDENAISNVFEFYVDNNKISDKNIKLTSKDAKLNVGVFPAEKKMYGGDNVYEYYFDVNNLTNENISNAILEIKLGKEYQCLSKYSDIIDYDVENGIVKMSVDNVKANEKIVKKITVFANNFEEDKFVHNAQISATVYVDEQTKYRSVVDEKEFKTTYFSIVQTCEKEGANLKKDEEIEYVFNIKNEGDVVKHITFSYNLPEGLIPISAEYQMYELNSEDKYQLVTKKESISNNLYINGEKQETLKFGTSVYAGESLQVKIRAKAGNLLESKEVVNIATLLGDNNSFTKISNAVKNKILSFDYKEETEKPVEPEKPEKPEEPDQPDNPDTPNNPDNPGENESTKEYKIDGVVWVDSNKDGKRDSDEELLENVTVRLFNIENGQIDVDSSNNPRKITTDSKGYYHFDNIKKGKYIVLFEYDSDKFDITTYKASTVDEDSNSDTIEKEINLDGKVFKAGVTDTIDLNKDYSNIDMGLIEKEKLDFRLDKYVSKITVNYKGTNKTYDYNDAKLAKVEIASKELADSVVNIEYKIVVKNEGNTSGYLKEIIDYIPEGLTLSQTSSQEWKMDSKNNLVNTSLANKEIEPGESKEVSITLTAKNVTKRLVNGAEIGKLYNVKGLQDIDSTDYNKDKNEDDYSEAEVIISVKTGIIKNILKIICGIFIILIFVGILYLIKNKKIGKIFIVGFLIVNAIVMIKPVNANDKITVKMNGYNDLAYTWTANGLKEHPENSGGTYMCVSPGGRLEGKEYTYAQGETRTYDSKEDLLNAIAGYDVIANQMKNQGIENINDSFSGKLPAGVKFGTTDAETGESVTKEQVKAEGEISGSIDSSDVGFKLISNDTVKIGPFHIKWSPDEAYVESSDVQATGGGSASLSGGISNGGSFYVIADMTANGISVDVNLYYEKKILRQVVSVTDYTPENATEGTQDLVTMSTETVEETIVFRKKLSASATIPKGSLKIKKTDYDTGDDLSGAKFLVKGTGENNSVYSNIVSTPVEVKNLLVGPYSVKEIGTPEGYRLDLQLKAELKKDCSISDGQTAEVEFKNRQYGDLEISKVDSRTLLNHLEGLPFSGVQFRIKSSIGYVGARVDDTWDKFEPTGKEDAQIFKTDSSGKFKILNLPIHYSYEIEEVDLPAALAQYYDVQSTNLNVKLVNNCYGAVSTGTYRNEQLRVDIQGSVWEDMAAGKTSLRDDMYGAGDKKVNGITVYLRKGGAVISQTITDSAGNYFFAAKGSNYTIDIATIEQYSVEFEYNGLKYENVDIAKGYSKAKEIDANREKVNKNYHNINGASKKDEENKGITGEGVNLTYTSGESYNSQLLQNTRYSSGSLAGSTEVDKAKISADTTTAGFVFSWSAGIRVIRGIDFGIYEREQPDLAIVSDIDNIQLTINNHTNTYEYKARSQYASNGLPDIDLNPEYNAVLDGFSVFVKNDRSGNYGKCSYTRKIYDSYIAYTKNDKNNSDRLRVFVNYKIYVKNESSGLVERVSLKNYADPRLGKVEQSYYVANNGQTGDVSWENTSSGVWTTPEIAVDINPIETMVVYLKYELNTDAIISLATKNEFELDRNVTEINSYSTWKDGKVYAGIDRDSAPNNINYNKIETYEDDTDAAPNLKFERKDSKMITGYVFEDNPINGIDKDGLNTNKERIGNGIYDGENGVENVNVEIKNYDTQETAMLYSLDNNGEVIKQTAQMYTKNGEYNFIGMVPGQYYIQYQYGTYKDGNGNVIKTVIKSPDKDIEVTTQDYKSTIVDYNILGTLIENNIENPSGKATIENDFNQKKNNTALWYWYENNGIKDYSSAVDNSTLRSNINKYLEKINYKVQNDYENQVDLNGNNSQYYYMISNTGIMDIPVEDFEKQVTDINYDETTLRNYQIKFGITQRPKQSLNVNKEISRIKITLADGQILAEGDPRVEKINYVTYPEGGLVKIEVDSEIIEGAHLEITYDIVIDSKSELDYDDIKYYRYGKVDETKLVKMNLDSIADYVDEKLSVTYDIDDSNSDFAYYDSGTQIKNKWQLITDTSLETNKLAGIDVNSEVYDDVQGRSNITVKNTDIKISPKDDPATIKLTAKKLLTTLNDEDQVYDNYTELIQVSNPVGRFYGQMLDGKWKYNTPGNFDIKTAETIAATTENDNSSYNRPAHRQPKLVIVPPTGESTRTIYITIIVLACITLAGGIILIIKKVMK